MCTHISYAFYVVKCKFWPCFSYNRDDQSVPDCLKLDACVLADTLNMLYLMESQQLKTGKVLKDIKTVQVYPLGHTFLTQNNCLKKKSTS